jgi:hypothetical protein
MKLVLFKFLMWFSLVAPHLPLYEFVRCREVCRAWRETVDTRSFAVWKRWLLWLHRSDVDEAVDVPIMVTINGLERTAPAALQNVAEDSGNLQAQFVAQYRAKVLGEDFWSTLGLNRAELSKNEKAVEMMRKYEEEGQFQLPSALKAFYSISDVHSYVLHCYPTNNDLQCPDCGDWEFTRESQWTRKRAAPAEQKQKERVFLRFLNENQGCCFWFVRFDPNDPLADPPVFVSMSHGPEDDYEEEEEEEEEDHDDENDDEGKMRLDNPCFSGFWSTMAKDGQKWYQENSSYAPSWMRLKKTEDVDDE